MNAYSQNQQLQIMQISQKSGYAKIGNDLIK